MKLFTMPNLKIYSFFKKNSVKVVLASTHGPLGTPHTVRWPCEQIILSIGHFKHPTEVQLNS